MITWHRVWPLLLLPYVLVFLIGLLPFIREAMLNHILIPVLPYQAAVDLVDWYRNASQPQELLVHLVLCLNLGTLFYPLFYLAGTVFIRITNSIAKSQINSLNQP